MSYFEFKVYFRYKNGFLTSTTFRTVNYDKKEENALTIIKSDFNIKDTQNIEIVKIVKI